MKYPVIIQRESRNAGAFGSITLKIDCVEVAKIQNGKSIRLLVEEGKHTLSFCIGRKDITSLDFTVGPDKSEICIKCFIKSNFGFTPVIQAHISDVIVEENISGNEQRVDRTSGGAFRILIGIIMLLVGLYILGVRLRFDFIIFPFLVT